MLSFFGLSTEIFTVVKPADLHDSSNRDFSVSPL